MWNFLFILLAVLMLGAHNFSILAVVGSHAISNQDVEEGVAIAQSKLFGKALEGKGVREKILENFIEQALILEECGRFNISATDQEVAGYLLSRIGVNSLSRLKEDMRQMGLSYEQLFAQARARLLWHKLISELVAPNITVNDDEIKEWQEQRYGKYNKIYTLYNLSAEGSAPKADAYSQAVSCENIEPFVASFGLTVGGKVSLSFSDLKSSIKEQITNGLQIGRLSKPLEGNNFVVVCAIEDNRNVAGEEEAYKLIYARKIEADKDAYLKKIKARYYASK